MTWTLKAHTNAAAASTSGIDTTGADLIVVSLVFYEVSGSENISDSYSNTWTQIGTRISQGSGQAMAWWYCQAPIVGAGHTFSTTSALTVLNVEAWSGSVASPLDQISSATGASTTIQPGSVTPGSANELVLTPVGASATSGSVTVDSGFTIPDAVVYGGFWGGAMAYLIQTSAVAENPTWTIPPSGGFGSIAAIATFKGSGGGGGGFPGEEEGHSFITVMT